VKEDCVEWRGPVNNKGYGQRSYQGKSQLAHRVAFFEAYGYWPNVCRHACDNRLCINTAHLADGTHADNTRDMMERGRHRLGPTLTGEAHPAAKLTTDDVIAIRRLYAMGLATQVTLARTFGIAQPTVSEIVRKKIWRTVEEA
jgi:hypothetical protein